MSPADSAPTVELATPSGYRVKAHVLDRSEFGLSVEMPSSESERLAGSCVVHSVNGRSSEVSYAQIRHRSHAGARDGWLRIGLAVSQVPPGDPIRVDRREHLVDRSASVRVKDRARMAAAAIRIAPNRVAKRLGIAKEATSRVPIESYLNDRGERIQSIVDSWGDTKGAPVVVIPPTWGRTKETLLPLAATIVETFRKARQPVVVVRFDGTHRRGESHLEPECRVSGDEYLRFTFSQAARDISATIDFLDSNPRYAPSTVILATFSLAAIPGRRAVAADYDHRIGGWVSVVGMIDLQSALKAISSSRMTKSTRSPW